MTFSMYVNFILIICGTEIKPSFKNKYNVSSHFRANLNLNNYTPVDLCTTVYHATCLVYLVLQTVNSCVVLENRAIPSGKLLLCFYMYREMQF